MNSLMRLAKWFLSWPKYLRESAFFRAEVGLGIAFFLAMIFYQNGQQLDHGQLFDLKLAITLAIVEVPLFMFSPLLYGAIINESRKKAEEEKKVKDEADHEKYILTKLYRSAQNGDVEYRNGEIFDGKFVWIEMLEDHADAISHLQSYENIIQLLDQARSYSDEITDKIEKKLKDYNEYVNKMLESFDGLNMSEKFLGFDTSHCNKPTARQMLYTNIMLAKQGKEQTEKLFLKKNDKDSYLLYGSQTFVIGNINVLEKFEEFLASLNNDVVLTLIISEILEWNKQLANNTALEQFESQRKEIVRQLDKGHKKLEGKCSLCS